MIQGDISKCFDNIPHNIIQEELKKIIGCEYTIRLINNSLKCGYQCPNTQRTIKSNLGVFQGNIASPNLANIVLHKLDLFMENMKLTFNKGIKRRQNPAYSKLINKRALSKDKEERHKLIKQMRKLTKVDKNDPNFRRMMYIRYADDFLVLIIGTMKEAHEIKSEISRFLKESCGLELNMDKTIISNTKEPFDFLGGRCKKFINMEKLSSRKDGLKTRTIGRMLIDIPLDKVRKNLIKNRFARFNKHLRLLPKGRGDLVNLHHSEILRFYNARVHGLINYYSFARNLHTLNYSI